MAPIKMGTLSREMLSAITEALTAAFMTFFVLREKVRKEGVNMTIWMFPKIGVPQNGWFMMENPIKIG